MNILVRRELRGEARIRIAAPPERVWSLISDITRMGEWSPECRDCEWLGNAAAPAVGASFRGHNRLGPWRWRRDVTITASDPGREFAFVTLGVGGAEQTRWRYQIDKIDGEAEVTESFECVTRPLYIHLWLLLPRMHGWRKANLLSGMRHTLDRVKAVAEKALDEPVNRD